VSKRYQSLLLVIIALVVIGILLIPAISAGSILLNEGNAAISPVGQPVGGPDGPVKIHSWLPEGINLSDIHAGVPDRTVIMSENEILCTNNNCYHATFSAGSIPKSPPVPPNNFSSRTDMYTNLVIPHKKSSNQDLLQLIDFNYKDISQTAACGNCSGQLFGNPFTFQYF
jgi:hypothetical protein